MSAAPGTEFPNPCPVCGADDDHAEWRAGIPLNACGDLCPHPAERGHGTGCCCGGRSRETRQLQIQDALERAARRVTVDKAALDALISYANSKRDQSDSQFLAGEDEYDRSQAEFDALVAALERFPS